MCRLPEMVVVPAGAFLMGSPENEADRDANEGPQRRVTITQPFALGRFELTVDQFAAFVAETGYDAGTVCDLWQDGSFAEQPGYSFRKTNFPQTGAHPAACLSWDDAKAYLGGCPHKTGRTYRLPSEAEWEYAARAGTTGRFHFGDNEAEYCRHGNGVDATALADVPGAREKGWDALPCRDGHAFTAPVGSFAPNAFASTTRTAMCSNGWRIAGTTISGARRPTARPGSPATARSGSSAAAPGAIRARISASPCAADRHRAIATSMRACGWRARSGGNHRAVRRAAQPAPAPTGVAGTIVRAGLPAQTPVGGQRRAWSAQIRAFENRVVARPTDPPRVA